MPDDTKQTPWWKEYKHLIWWVVTIIATGVAGLLGVQVAPVPPPVFVDRPVDRPIFVEPPDELFAPTQGWVRDADVIAANLDEEVTLHFATTPAGKAVLGDDDVFLWRAVRKVNNKAPPWYPNVNQGSVGCCVGAGWKHCADVAQATAIAMGAQFEWKPTAVEPIYAGSRVEVGGGRISGDGSIGAWAKDWCQSRGGLVPMEKLGTHDLTTFSPARARDWGRRGVPDDLEPGAKQHPIKSCALVKSAAEAKRAIQQGYPIPVCSDQGFRMERDATGRCRAQGSWAHCMSIIGYRHAEAGRAEGFFVLNSWGDNAHTGPVWPDDAPKAGFWADYATVDRMLKQGDSFALSDVAGFPQRKPLPDWFVERRAVPVPDPLTRIRGELSLSW